MSLFFVASQLQKKNLDNGYPVYVVGTNAL